MTTLQLVHGSEYTVVENPYDQAPASFKNLVESPVLLGSQDLIRIAVLLRDVSFVTAAIVLVDRNFSSLDEDQADSISEDLLPLLRKGSEAEITRYMWDSARGIYIMSITFIDTKSPSSRLTVRQKGVVNATNTGIGTRFAGVLNTRGFHG